MKTETVKFQISGMTCDNCARTVEKSVRGKEGLVEGKVSYKDKTGEFTFDPGKMTKEKIIAAINATGHYKVAGEITDNPEGDSKQYDLIIIGGGSAAFAAAIRAEELGLSTLMVNDMLPVGGTCVNVGCVPSKNLIRAAESLHKAAISPFRGVHPRGADLDYKEIISQKRELVGTLRQKKYKDILEGLENVTFVRGFAEFTDEHTIITDGSQTYKGLKFLIATGASTQIPPVSGLERIRYLTNRSLFELEIQPESLIVLGGGYIALEIAQAWQRLGTKVTLLQRSAHVLSRQTADVAEEITKHLRDEGVEIHTALEFRQVTEKGNKKAVTVVRNGKTLTFEAEQLLVSTGIRPNTDRLGTERIGLELTGTGHIRVNKHLETNISHIFAAGDCIDTPAYVYTAAYEGKLAVENAFTGAGREAGYTGMPWVVFTDPEVAGVGMDEKEAESKGIPYEVSRVDLSDVPRSLAALDTRGFVKLIRNPENDLLLGARIVAPGGSELTMELSLAIKYGIPVSELAASFHAYLTLSEAVKLAAIGFGRDVKTLSCCAV
ncbi:MAG: mercury(II) reductase [Chlorobi bacterium]|nr:mercury(II) reductase [Chlorobiota bacterium]